MHALGIDPGAGLLRASRGLSRALPSDRARTGEVGRIISDATSTDTIDVVLATKAHINHPMEIPMVNNRFN